MDAKVLLASGITASFVVAGLSAWRLLAAPSDAAALKTLRFGARLAAVLVPLQIFAGDQHGLNTLEQQPAKVAAIEALWHTERGAPLVLFALIDEELRPPERQIHFPTQEALVDYSARIEGLGGADVCYGGIGWCGHIAFWESHLGEEFAGDLEAYKQAGARLVELHPMTIMQNALHSFGGDWSWVPPKANTIGPREILGAKHRSFWLDGDIGGGVSWQRFIARLVAHGPVSEFVPGSILQTAPTDYTILGGVADDVEIHMA